MSTGMNLAGRVAAASLALATFAGTTMGQANEQWRIEPGVGTSTQRAGLGLAVQGGLMVIGAPYEDTKAADAGAVAVYRWNATTKQWALEQQLFASDPETSARFGHSVAVDGDLLVVGAPYRDTAKGADAGQVYVFRYDSSSKTWSQEQKLTSSVGALNDYFGTSVGVSGNLVLVGVPRADTTAGADSGCAFAYRYKNSIVKWVEEKQLVDPDGATSDYAGECVAVSGSMAVVSSHLADEGLYDVGSVGVWTVSGSAWTQVQELKATTPQYYAGFGTRLALSGDLLAVCASSEDESTLIYDSGAVYLFRNVGGSFVSEKRFTAPTPTSYTYFGSDVAVATGIVAIGFQTNTVGGKGSAGSTLLFRLGFKTGWVFDQELAASDFNSSDRFGGRIAMNSEQILVAADGNDVTAGSDWGVIYGFDISEITLSITPASPVPDETITFSAFRGEPGEACMITVEDVSGTPTFLPLLVYIFGTDHTLTFTADAPNPAYGLHVGMRAYKVSPTGPVVFSDMTYVDI